MFRKPAIQPLKAQNRLGIELGRKENAHYYQLLTLKLPSGAGSSTASANCRNFVLAFL
jgi:hypothetical protein